jgi:hypothetical protein
VTLVAADAGKPDRSIWSVRAEHLLEKALGEVIDGLDAIGTVDLVLTVLRIEADEMPADEVEGYPWPGEEEDETGCICPPDILKRGGFRSGCPVHSLVPRYGWLAWPARPRPPRHPRPDDHDRTR